MGIEGDIDVDELVAESIAAGSSGDGVLDATHTGAPVVERGAVRAVLSEVTAATPRQFRPVAESVLQMSGGQPGPAFVQQVLALSRVRATAAVLEGGPWESRPAAFEFVVALHAAADGDFRAALERGLTDSAARLQAALSGEGEGEAEDDDDEAAAGGSGV